LSTRGAIFYETMWKGRIRVLAQHNGCEYGRVLTIPFWVDTQLVDVHIFVCELSFHANPKCWTLERDLC